MIERTLRDSIIKTIYNKRLIRNEMYNFNEDFICNFQHFFSGFIFKLIDICINYSAFLNIVYMHKKSFYSFIYLNVVNI